MSGPRRLAVLLSGVWVAGVLALSSFDDEFKGLFFAVVGVAPVAFAWGVWWVVAGFRQPKH